MNNDYSHLILMAKVKGRYFSYYTPRQICFPHTVAMICFPSLFLYKMIKVSNLRGNNIIVIITKNLYL